MTVMIREAEGYWLFPDPFPAEYPEDPIVNVDEATYARWEAIVAAWKGLQAELTALYHQQSAREFRAEMEHLEADQRERREKQ